ncbi:MAG: protein of unknown function, DUF2797 [Candidatus Nanosalina sp. J07AB43]|nr:MAG: protein of unknown function, DUF2797 [Candidatus Nanosalina sp. J07AB43]
MSWKKGDSGYEADLLTAEPSGFETITLVPERSFSFEIVNERRCTGYAPEPGERAVCPEFRKIESGSQCSECRGKDIYSGYVRGDKDTDLDGSFSVYMAQISKMVKVGVTRDRNIPSRWVEQGADFGARVRKGLESGEALKVESRISSDGLAERIRKEAKLPPEDKPDLLRQEMKQRDFRGEVQDVQDLTRYSTMSASGFQRSGLFEGELESVRGQVISNGRLAMPLTSGKVIKKPEQKGLNSF